jgi:hypothetical protein
MARQASKRRPPMMPDGGNPDDARVHGMIPLHLKYQPRESLGPPGAGRIEKRPQRGPMRPRWDMPSNRRPGPPGARAAQPPQISYSYV